VITHDLLAFSVASEIITQVRAANPDWSILSPSAYTTSARIGWPVPDFVIADPANAIFVGAEFKPPDQTKREYLTGLGQAVAYTRDFTHALLIVPLIADDGTQIADHIHEVLAQDVASNLPISLVAYDQNLTSATSAAFTLLTKLATRSGPVPPAPHVANSFWAKWRDASPQELGLYLVHLYDQGLVAGTTSIRDRAFDLLWIDIQAGRAEHWQQAPRSIANSPANRVAWGKNYRNFVSHIGWMLPDGKLTEAGLQALRTLHLYGPWSRVFIDLLARAVLLNGQHLVLINTINEFQDRRGPEFPSEQDWLDELEDALDAAGMLERNPGRHAAAVAAVPRGFLKAEKTLWRNLDLFVPYGPSGGRAYHPGRGLLFNWRRITALLS
jgi:hypothetical protein